MNTEKAKDIPFSQSHLTLNKLAVSCWLIGLALATVFIYLPSLKGPLFFDDIPAIEQNPAISGPLTIDNLFDTRSQGPLAGRPLVALSFALNYRIAGLNPWGYKITNVCIHILNLFLVFNIFFEITKRFPSVSNPSLYSLFASTVWAFHPINSEAVAYVTQRTELMAGFFSLAAIALHLRAYNESSKRLLNSLLSGTCLIFGVLCKESAAVIPVAIMLVDRGLFFGSWKTAFQRRKYSYAALFASWAVVIPIIMLGPRSRTVGWDLGLSGLEYLKMQSIFIPQYFQTLLWPKNLLIHYPEPDFANQSIYLWPAAFWAAITFLLFRFGLRNWKNILPFALCAILLGPTSSIIPIISEHAAERRMYLPSIVAIGALALIVSPIGKPTAWLALFAALSFGLRTHIQAYAYQSPITLWEQVLEIHPEDHTTLSALGDQFYREGNEAKALETYERSFESGIGHVGSIINAARIKLQANDPNLRNPNHAHLLAQTAVKTIFENSAATSDKMKIESLAILAESALETNHLEEAENACRRGLELAIPTASPRFTALLDAIEKRKRFDQ